MSRLQSTINMKTMLNYVRYQSICPIICLRQIIASEIKKPKSQCHAYTKEWLSETLLSNFEIYSSHICRISNSFYFLYNVIKVWWWNSKWNILPSENMITFSSGLNLPSSSMKRFGLNVSGSLKLLASNKTESSIGRIVVPSGISYPLKSMSRDVECGMVITPRPNIRRTSVRTALQYGSCALSSHEGRWSLPTMEDISSYILSWQDGLCIR